MKAELLGLEESARIFEKLKRKQESKIVFGGMEIAGFFDVVCRDEDGSVAWEVHQPNILTDYGRRKWANDHFYRGRIFTSGVGDIPLVTRYSLIESTGFAQVDADVDASSNASAMTKTWSKKFLEPAAIRDIAAIGIAHTGATSSMGMTRVACYSLITPIKKQTTTQTLEVSYRLTMSPEA